MGRIKMKFALELLVAGALAIMLLVPACREERPPLDRNKAPETFITNAPPYTTESDYRVHMYWHGKDEDGVVVKYIYYISDTLMPSELDWNPNERIADYLMGRFTFKTDTIIAFKGFDESRVATTNKQAFHIAAIDDGGKIDPDPAVLQFTAKVRGVPTVLYWTNVTSEPNNPDSFTIYDPNVPDTISMFVPFSIKFMGETMNHVITGYRWVYSGKVYPDENGDGNPEWYEKRLTEPQIVSFRNHYCPPESLLKEPPCVDDHVPNGVFNFRVIARDEAGALSKFDIKSGEGMCKVEVNHPPDTRILRGEYIFMPQSSGQWDTATVDFSDGSPDTLPYNSLLRMVYLGWDDPKDREHLQYTKPPLPIRFQFQFSRWSINEYGVQVATKDSPWYPLKVPEDTNPNADLEPAGIRNQDSTTMRVGTFDYRFQVRSFDEQNRADAMPAAAGFIGNYPPRLDSVQVGFYNPSSPGEWIDATRDTLHVGWMCRPNVACGDKLSPFSITLNTATKMLTKSFRFIIRAGGHDDRRDPPGSGIKGWKYEVRDSVGQDLTYYKEGEWMFDRPLNRLEHECIFSITAPYKSNIDSILAQADSLVNHPPLFLGKQGITVTGMDIKDTDVFLEGVRGITPKFDANGKVIPGSYWIQNEYFFANYSRKDSRSVHVYLKLVK